MRRSLFALLATAASAVALAQTPAAAEKPADKAAAPAADKAAPAKAGNIAVVNGTAIKSSEVDLILRQIKQPDTAETRAAVREKLIEMELLVQEARKRKLTDREDVKFAIDNARRELLVRAVLMDEVETHKLSDEQVKAEYERQVKGMSGEKEYHAHHILVDSEASAKDIIAKLDKGAKFEDLAKASKDPGSGANGGDLGWAPAAAYVKPFSEAMVKLEKGKYTAAPVQSQFGWHVIRLDEERQATPPSMEQARSHIVDGMRQELVREFVEQLKKKATIK
jgi:peptidyl-prolyl cis-trans isomerase C